MAKKGERFVGTTRFDEGFVWESKETRYDDICRIGRARYEGSKFNLTMSGR